jgi:hypothetical protein
MGMCAQHLCRVKAAVFWLTVFPWCCWCRLQSVQATLNGDNLDEAPQTEEHLSEQLDAMPYLCRFQYQGSRCGNMGCALLSSLISRQKLLPCHIQAAAITCCCQSLQPCNPLHCVSQPHTLSTFHRSASLFAP